MTRTNWFRAIALLVAVLIAGCGGGTGEPAGNGGTGDETNTSTDENGGESSTDETTDEGGEGETTEEETTEEETTEEESTEEETSATEPAGEPSETAATETKVTGDWAMWGGTVGRNMVNATTGVTIDFGPDTGRLLWSKPAGSQAYANPVVAGGRVFVGANNGSAYRPKYDTETDLGVVLCFDEKTGDLQWQLSRTKLAAGRVNDWPEQGICSTPVVEGEHLYVVTNRAEIMCLDVNGLANGNQGFDGETDTEAQDADILWSLDMIEDLGVFPHNLATSSPVVYGDHIFIVTSNGVGEEHLEVPAPRAPSFIAVNKKTGELVWEDNTPFDGILHGQWSSPAVAELDGKAQILMAGGDGWLFSFDPAGDGEGGGKINWKFDLNPKDTHWLLGGEGTRNAIISTPVVVDDSVVLAVGQDPEHGNGVGHLYRIALDKTGDVSPVLVVDADGEVVDPHEEGQLYDETKGHQIKPNPNSAQIWHFGGVDDEAGTVTGKKEGMIYRRTISTVAVSDGLVFAADLMGFLHCIDFETGKRYWEFDTFGEIWGSPMVVDGKVFLGDAEGDLTVFAANKGEENEKGEVEAVVLTLNKRGKPGAIVFPNSIYSTPTVANGNMYVTDRNTLYAFDVTPGNDEKKTAAAESSVE